MRFLRPHSRGDMIRYLGAGAFNTAFSYAIYAGGLALGLAYPAANLASLICGVMAGFITQGHFVFGKASVRRFPLFAAAWLVLWGVNVSLIGLFLAPCGGNAYVAGLLSTLIMVPLSFLVQKHLVFGGGSGR